MSNWTGRLFSLWRSEKDFKLRLSHLMIQMDNGKTGNEVWGGVGRQRWGWLCLLVLTRDNNVPSGHCGVLSWEGEKVFCDFLSVFTYVKYVSYTHSDTHIVNLTNYCRSFPMIPFVKIRALWKYCEFFLEKSQLTSWILLGHTPISFPVPWTSNSHLSWPPW